MGEQTTSTQRRYRRLDAQHLLAGHSAARGVGNLADGGVTSAAFCPRFGVMTSTARLLSEIFFRRASGREEAASAVTASPYHYKDIAPDVSTAGGVGRQEAQLRTSRPATGPPYAQRAWIPPSRSGALGEETSRFRVSTAASKRRSPTASASSAARSGTRGGNVG